MAFRLEDFKKTTRKSADGSGVPASVFPHQLKDKKAIARLEIAIRTFDGLVGKRRGDLDAQTMTDFFGDPRLARGIVACLGQFYKYETPRFSQIAGEEPARRLAEGGLLTSRDVRAHTYAHVNEACGGFLAERERAGCYAELGRPFGLSAHLWDSLLHLDAEDNQLLTRPGPVPAPADIIALYNFHSLDTPLRRATAVRLTGLSLSSGEGSDARSLARSLGVKAVISGDGSTITLSPPLSGEGGFFAARPGRLARCLLHLAQTHATRGTTGYIDALLGGRPFRLALAADALKVLGANFAKGDVPANFRRRFDAADALHKDLLKLRARGEANGWRIKRLPDPIVSPLGVLLPDFKLTRDGATAYALLGADTAHAWDAPVLSLPLGRKPLDACALLAQAEQATCNLFAWPLPTRRDIPGDVRTLCDRAAAQGMVGMADAQRLLHLLDESPLIEWVKQMADPRVRYIPGVGLCSQELVAAIQEIPRH